MQRNGEAGPPPERVRGGWCAWLQGGGLCGAGGVFEAGADGVEGVGGAEDDEDGVIAGDGAEDLVPFLAVESDGQGLSATGEGMDDDEVVDAFGGEEEGGCEALEAGGLVGGVGGHVVGGVAVGSGLFDEAEGADVAGEGALADVEALVCEEVAELVLGPDGVVPDELEDGGVAAGPGGHDQRRNPRSSRFSRSPAISASSSM